MSEGIVEKGSGLAAGAIVKSGADAGAGGGTPAGELPALLAGWVGGEDVLPPAQQTAMEHLASGITVTEAARLAGVRRETVHRWLRDDPRFVAAYNAWRNEVRNMARTRLLATLSDAVDCVQRAIREGNVPLSFRLLRVMHVAGPVDPLPPADEDPRLVKKQMKDLARERANRLRRPL